MGALCLGGGVARGQAGASAKHERLQLLSHRNAKQGPRVVAKTFADKLGAKLFDSTASRRTRDLKSPFKGGGNCVHEMS
jgi:hypothetical protein